MNGYSISALEEGSRLARSSLQGWWHLLLPLPALGGRYFPSGFYFSWSCSIASPLGGIKKNPHLYLANSCKAKE